MTHESYAAIAFTLDDVGYELIADIRSAAARATKAEPGDRLDITRFEALSSQLEALAMTQFDQGVVRVQLDRAPPPDAVALIAPARVGEFVNAPEWLPEAARGRVQAVLNRGGVLLTVASPLQRGATARPSETIAPPRPIATWKSETDARGSAAVRERFEDQLRRAVTFGERPSPEPISPTGIQNKVLTETLREYVKKIEGQQRVDVPVEYRDGSRAEHPFPLRSLQLTSESTSRVDRDLSFALLSIRHTELDAIVDGAWLRNLQISQPRAQALTDNLVYGISREQLSVLTESGTKRIRLRMYQTGLEPAIVGFYRAVAHQLLEYPGSLSVVPMFYQAAASPSQRGKREASRTTGMSSSSSTKYRAGEPWATEDKSEAR